MFCITKDKLDNFYGVLRFPFQQNVESSDISKTVYEKGKVNRLYGLRTGNRWTFVDKELTKLVSHGCFYLCRLTEEMTSCSINFCYHCRFGTLWSLGCSGSRNLLKVPVYMNRNLNPNLPSL